MFTNTIGLSNCTKFQSKSNIDAPQHYDKLKYFNDIINSTFNGNFCELLELVSDNQLYIFVSNRFHEFSSYILKNTNGLEDQNFVINRVRLLIFATQCATEKIFIDKSYKVKNSLLQNYNFELEEIFKLLPDEVQITDTFMGDLLFLAIHNHFIELETGNLLTSQLAKQIYLNQAVPSNLFYLDNNLIDMRKLLFCDAVDFRQETLWGDLFAMFKPIPIANRPHISQMASIIHTEVLGEHINFVNLSTMYSWCNAIGEVKFFDQFVNIDCSSQNNMDYIYINQKKFNQLVRGFYNSRPFITKLPMSIESTLNFFGRDVINSDGIISECRSNNCLDQEKINSASSDHEILSILDVDSKELNHANNEIYNDFTVDLSEEDDDSIGQLFCFSFSSKVDEDEREISNNISSSVNRLDFNSLNLLTVGDFIEKMILINNDENFNYIDIKYKIIFEYIMLNYSVNEKFANSQVNLPALYQIYDKMPSLS